MFKVPEKYRLAVGSYGTTAKDGNNGVFIIPLDFHKRIKAQCIASDGEGWEHVSVTLLRNEKPLNVTPYWDYMCFIKDMFWSEEDVVIQYHPAKSDYVNYHKHCLHLWRKIGFDLPVPPSIFVGINKP